MADFSIEDGVLKKYTGYAEEAVVPDGITEISKNAFSGFVGLKSVTLPEGLRTIGDGAFEGCKKLKDINIPDSVESIGTNAFSGCWALEEINIPDSITSLGHQVFFGCIKIKRAYMPSSFCCPGKVSAEIIFKLINQFRTKIVIKDYVGLYLFHSSSKLLKEIGEVLIRNPEEVVKSMTAMLIDNGKPAHYQKAAEFCLEHRRNISQETITALYEAAVAAKAKKAVEYLEPYAGDIQINSDKKCCDEIADGEPAADSNSGGHGEIEAFCHKIYTRSVFEQYLKKRQITEKWFKSVKYKGSEDFATAFVVECAVVPYMQQLTDIPTHIGSYNSAFSPFGIDPNADKVADELDPESFGEMLDDLIGRDMPSVYHTLVPYGRYASGKQVSGLIARMNKWKKWNDYSATGRKSIIVARGALLLNDSREAMLYADKQGILHRYAKIRGKDADVIRDTVLSDFGLDENGKKSFELGNTTIEVSVNRELKLSLYDTSACKEVKSIPKRGADPDKYEKAKTEFADIKKNLKEIVKNRSELLFNDFLSGKTTKPDSWKASYLDNYILHKVGELVVWSQSGDTFILSETGIVDCNGNDYEINDKDPIFVAHPMQMTNGEKKAWQRYFTSHGLKQPFEQVWEPVIDTSKLKHDRYAGRMIPYYRFLKKEKHGIHVQDTNFHDEIYIHFDDCSADVERVDWARHQIDMNHRFEVKRISVRRPSKMSNHVLALLDKFTAIDRVMADDMTIIEMLPDLSYAQIIEYINIANENNANNVLAALMDYKNENFADFDPMEEFILD